MNAAFDKYVLQYYNNSRISESSELRDVRLCCALWGLKLCSEGSGEMNP